MVRHRNGSGGWLAARVMLQYGFRNKFVHSWALGGDLVHSLDNCRSARMRGLDSA